MAWRFISAAASRGFLRTEVVHPRSTATYNSRGKVAEGVGFEPTIGCPMPVFKTGAFNHSATPPDDQGGRYRENILKGKF